MNLYLYNSMSCSKELFTPIQADNIGVYVCGPTVYDFAHLGNARSAIAFDILHRLLRYIYPKVTWVRNITDVDDKIIERARLNGESIQNLTARTHAAYLEDMDGLAVLRASHEPKATEHIAEMQAMIAKLINLGNAYEAEAHVLFSVSSNPNHGRLSGHDQANLREGARVERAPFKRDGADFVLWKPALPQDKDGASWSSPWGQGRPGWHIECSAMAAKHLGKTFDIHGGGHDLLFPHHENEISQSTCAHGTEEMANVWMHNGMLTVDGKKMSKSAGNFFTVRDVAARFPNREEALRLVLLSSHYRQDSDFTWARVEEAVNKLTAIYRILSDANVNMQNVQPLHINRFLEGSGKLFLNSLLDDLNVPAAFEHFYLLSNAVQTDPSLENIANLKTAADLLGILQKSPEEWLRGSTDRDHVQNLIDQRTTARKNRDFAGADEIRKQLKSLGIRLEDQDGKTLWFKE